MIKQGVIHKGHKVINLMAINMVINMVVSLHTKTATIKMDNTTTIKLSIKIINIQINNIVDIQDLMVGKIKDIDRIL